MTDRAGSLPDRTPKNCPPAHDRGAPIALRMLAPVLQQIGRASC